MCSTAPGNILLSYFSQVKVEFSHGARARWGREEVVWSRVDRGTTERSSHRLE